MRGVTNSGLKVHGNCLKPSKKINGSKWTRPTPRLQAQNLDTKVTLISPEQLTSMKDEISLVDKATKTKQSYIDVLRGGIWGPPLSTPVWNTTSETFHVKKKPIIDESSDMEQTNLVKATEKEEEAEVIPPVLKSYANCVKIEPLQKPQPQVITKKSKIVESKIPRVQEICELVSKSKKTKGVKEIAANEKWPIEVNTKKLPSKVVLKDGVATKNRFKLDVEDIVNTVTKMRRKKIEKGTDQKKTEKPKQENNKIKKSKKNM